MRRTARIIVLVFLAATGWPGGASAQVAARTAVLADLEGALRTGQIADFITNHTSDLPADQRDWLAAVTPQAGVTTARVRERGFTDDAVLADVFVANDGQAFVASWVVGLTDATPEGTRRIESIREVSRFGDLVRLALDESRQFRVTGLVITGPDFTLRLPSGVVFFAPAVGRPTTLVLAGRSTVQFSPRDPNEQGQLRIFAGEAALDTTADEAFVRIDPDDDRRAVTWETLAPVAVEPAALARARRVFESRALQGHRIELGDLDAEPWSLTPSPGSLFVDFNSSRRGWLSYNRSPHLEDDVSLFDRENRRQISLYRSTTEPRLVVNGAEPFEVTHIDVDVAFDPERLWLSGRASLTLRMTQAASAFQLRVAETLVVSSVSSPELGRVLPLRPSGQDALLVGLPVTVPAGSTVTIDVQYHGRLRPQEPQALRRRNTDLDLVAVETVGTTTGPRYLYSNESGWYPRPSSGHHAPATIRLTVPEDFSTVATGSVVTTATSERADSGLGGSVRRVRTTTFRADRPVRYLAFLAARMALTGVATARVPAVAVAAGRSERTTEVAVSVLAGRDRTRDLRATPGRVASIVEFYARVVGEAPYPSLTIAALEDNVPGGHSPAQFALINQAHVAANADWSRDPVAFSDFPDFFVAHEIAHQWWGQAVAGDDYKGQWISEGFAQYFAWMYLASLEGDEAGRRLMTRMRESTDGLAAEGPISLGFRLGHLRGNPRVFRSILYNKSAVVLHLLRRLIGDEAFMRGVRAVYATHRFSLIDTADVERAFQNETSVPLARFFTRWVREAAAPDLRFSWRQASPGVIAINVAQAGDAFDLPWEVTIHYRDGTRQQAAFPILAAETEVLIPVRGPMRDVDFRDPLTPARVRP